MRGAPGARGARELRGRFKEAPGRGRARAGRRAGGPGAVSRAAAALPPPRRQNGGGGLRTRAEPGPPRGKWQSGLREVQAAPPRARAGALFRGGRCGRPRARPRTARAESALELAVGGLLPPPQAPAWWCASGKPAAIEPPVGSARPPPRQPRSRSPPLGCLSARARTRREVVAGVRGRGGAGGGVICPCKMALTRAGSTRVVVKFIRIIKSSLLRKQTFTASEAWGSGPI